MSASNSSLRVEVIAQGTTTVLTLDGAGTCTRRSTHVLFDINNDDQDEETILSMTLTRQ